MNSESASREGSETRQIYYLSPWRRFVAYFVLLLGITGAGFLIQMVLWTDQPVSRLQFVIILVVAMVFLDLCLLAFAAGVNVRLVVSVDGLEYYGGGRPIRTTWNNVAGIARQPMPRQGPVSGLRLHQAAFKPSRWTSLFGLLNVEYLGRFIPVEHFDPDWERNELGELIRRYAPHVFQPDSETEPVFEGAQDTSSAFLSSPSEEFWTVAPRVRRVVVIGFLTVQLLFVVGVTWIWSGGTALQRTWRQDEGIRQMALSPDGQTLAMVMTWGSQVYLQRLPNGAPIQTLERPNLQVASVAFSPDGRFIASGTDAGRVQLWRADGTLLFTLSEHTDEVNSVAFSPDGKILASGSTDGKVRLWRTEDGQLLETLEAGHEVSAESVTLGDRVVIAAIRRGVQSLAFSPDGQTLASGAGVVSDAIRLWQVADGQLIRVLQPSGFVDELVFAPDGQTLAAANLDEIQLWRVSDGTLLRTFFSSGFVGSAAFSPDGQILASGWSNGLVRLWRVADGSPLCTLRGHTDFVTDVLFAPDGQTLISGATDQTIRFWTVCS